MNKISLYLFIIFLSLSFISVHSQGNRRHNSNPDQPTNAIFSHTVEQGETVYAIAIMYGVDKEDVYRLNPDSRDFIKIGSVLRIPQPKVSGKTAGAISYRFHTIQPKETLYSLSVMYSTPAETIMDANPGLSVATFTIGKTIRIPVVKAGNVTEKPAKPQQSKEVKEIEYTIGKKETMYRICRKFDISSVDLIKRNPILKEGIKAGLVIKVPVTSRAAIAEKAGEAGEATMDERNVNALLSNVKEAKHTDNIKIALLLPFTSGGEIAYSAVSRIIEYYEGFLLAVADMRDAGCSIDLTVYDTNSEKEPLKDILNSKSLKEAHLIIGGIENEEIALIAAFAQKNKIKYVIPFMSKNDDVLSSSYVFQVNTPHSYLYSKAAQGCANLFADYNITFLNMPTDNEKEDFVSLFKAELRQKRIAFKEFTWFSDTFAADAEAMMSPTKRNLIVPTSGTHEYFNKIKVPLRALAEKSPQFGLTLLGYPEWQIYTGESPEEFYALNTYIYSKFYADNLSPDVAGFYTRYKTWYSKNLINIFPKYGMLGFDTGMYFMKAINQFGVNFENNLDKIKYTGIQTDFDFRRLNNWGGFVNTSVFFVHYQNDFKIIKSTIR